MYVYTLWVYNHCTHSSNFTIYPGGHTMLEEQATRKYVLAIDLGTGGPKVGLVDQAGRVACSARAPVRVIFLPDDGVENDPAEWWTTITSCTKQVIQESGVSPDQIIAIGVTSCWSVLVAVDEQGEPLMNALSWMDLRGSPYTEALMDGFPKV